VRRVEWISKLRVVMLLLAAASTPALAESLTYEAYEVVSPKKRRLIDQGTVQYDPLRDVRSVREVADGMIFWTRSVDLPIGFLIAAHVTVDATEQHTGFGLRVLHRRYPLSSSWEWYTKDVGDEFNKLQGIGRVRTEWHNTAGMAQLVRVEFLDDTELRFCSNLFRCRSHGETHVLIIRRGSVLALGAPVPVESPATPAVSPATPENPRDQSLPP
jgi:hypothetical protein